MLKPYKLFWQYRSLLWLSVKSTLKARYAGSLFGRGWLVVGPLLLLGLYTLIYTVVFRFRPTGMELSDYIMYIFSGLVPFIAFAQCLGAGTASLTADQGLLLNKIFPAELIPVREVLAAGSMIVVGGFVVMVFEAFTGSASWTWLFLPVNLVLMAMASIGIVWGFALLNLIAKDTLQMITYLVIMLLIASPIAYTPQMLPGTLKLLIYFNPLAYYFMSFQSILVLGELPPTPILIGSFVIAFVLFHGMYHVFGKSKFVISDLL